MPVFALSEVGRSRDQVRDLVKSHSPLLYMLDGVLMAAHRGEVAVIIDEIRWCIMTPP